MLNLDKNKRYLLACSFGPDSMYLCYLLLEEGYSFDVAHVNYHLRDESDDEERKLRDFCLKHNLKIYVLNNKEKIERNVEARCREIRYSFFEDLYKKNHYDTLLVAHHQDDLLETYLLQKKRKNLVNCYGIAPKTNIKGMTVVRPLLDVTKKDILNYCNNQNIPYSIDKTNLVPIYERNKIRICKIEKMNETERKDLLKEIETQNKRLKELLNKIKSADDTIDSLNQLTDEEFAYYLNRKVKEIDSRFNVTYKQCLEVRRFCDSQKPNISVFAEKNRVLIQKTYSKLLVLKNESQNGYSFAVNKPQIIDNEFIFANLLTDTENRNIYPNDYPLTIRTYLKGDLYKIKCYSVQVRRLFIDWKMPTFIRQRWPLVVNKDGIIIYIPRYREDFVPDNETNFYVKECFTLK